MSVTSSIYPSIQTINWDRKGDQPGVLKLKISILETDGPSQILHADFTIAHLDSDIKWLIAPEIMNGTVSNIENGLFYINLSLQNLEYLPSGSYTAKAYVTIMDEDGLMVSTLESKISLNLYKDNITPIATDSSLYNLIFNRANNSFSGDSLVTIKNNKDSLSLKFWQNGNVFEAAENFTESFNLIENAANPLATNPAIPTTGTVNIPAKILKQTGEFVSGFNISLLVIDGGIVINPKNFSFEISKGTEKSQTLSVVNPLGVAFTITQVPAWLRLNAVSGNTDKVITLTTETSNINEGVYADIIKFEHGGKVIEIPVRLNLTTFISIDQTKEFCLDLPEVIVTKKTPEAMMVRITISATYEVLGTETILSKVYSQNYFQDRVLFGLGEKLHRHFPRIKKHFFDDQEVDLIKHIKASMKVEELDINRKLLFEQTVSNIYLFPGKKPQGYPFLTNSVFRKKNNKSIIFSSTVTGTAVILNKIKEVNLPNPLIYKSGSIKFFDFPKVYQPIHLQWENQNLVPEWFTLTGDFTITPEFNHVYARNIFNAQNEKYDLSEVQTLNINTGLIMAKERPLIREMIRSKLCFIKIGETVYRCFNITKKMTLQDSKEELLSNDLEFLIVEQ